jgi:hypothetical protein
MSKLRVTILVPIFQLLLALTLLLYGHEASDPVRLDTMYVPTPTFVCYGTNAPVLLMRPIIGFMTHISPDHKPSNIFGFGFDEIIFLVAVTLFWYLVVRRFISFRDRKMTRSSSTISTVFWPAVYAVVGMLLLIFGAASMWSLGRWNNHTGNLVEALLFLLWATLLLCLAGISIVEAIRPKALLPTAQVK